ncbi:hypothetical protein KY289_010734 [Solanum tuberosum]|nr:hypothetical protein KY289_010734 [Solanum tuberosum]
MQIQSRVATFSKEVGLKMKLILFTIQLNVHSLNMNLIVKGMAVLTKIISSIDGNHMDAPYKAVYEF